MSYVTYPVRERVKTTIQGLNCTTSPNGIAVIKDNTDITDTFYKTIIKN
jgi:hypothetical protein